MFQIVEKKKLNDAVVMVRIAAPLIAKKVLPGQFIIFRLFSLLEAGDSILDLVGPLGVPTELPEGTKSVCVIGGGVGCAIAYPQAKHLHSLGLEVDTIVGFRNKDIVILEDEFRACSDKTIVSLNPSMVDGTGMCGGCRVTVGGKTKYACVDGPDFDGHQVDFDELMRRNGTYKRQEQECNLFRKEVQ